MNVINAFMIDWLCRLKLIILPCGAGLNEVLGGPGVLGILGVLGVFGV